MTAHDPTVLTSNLAVASVVWHAPDLAPLVALHQVPRRVIDALASGNLARARAGSAWQLPPDLVSPANRSTWRIRSSQLAEHPEHAPWITRILTLDGAVVGKAGFHGPPDPHTGMVEVGYSVAAEHRRQGLARAAFRLMRAVAEGADDARVLRATVSPGNTPSRRLIESEGLVEVGDQWDDEDGLEIVYELALLR